MGSALYGWVEVTFGEGWRPLYKVGGRLFGPKTWYRVPLDGNTRGTETLPSREEDGVYFDPVDRTYGVPDDLSETVRIDVFGTRTEDGTVRIREPAEVFLRPGRDLFVIPYERLRAVDWDAPRKDVAGAFEDALEMYDGSWVESELVGRAFRLERRDSDGRVMERRVDGVPTAVALATIGRTTQFPSELLEACPTEVPDEYASGEGPIADGEGHLHAVRPSRRDFAQPGLFTLLDLMDEVSRDGSDVRLFCHFSH